VFHWKKICSKIYKGHDLQLHTSSALVQDKLSDSQSECLPLGKCHQFSMVGPQTDLMTKTKIPAPARNLTPDIRPITSHYSYWTITIQYYHDELGKKLELHNEYMSLNVNMCLQTLSGNISLLYHIIAIMILICI
jgi:hypothetical protein